MLEKRQFLISCEHGGNQVPPGYQELFRGKEQLLGSHFGFDLGALPLARVLAKMLAAPLCKSEVTRLLVDLNRALRSKSLFSAQLASLDEAQKEEILRGYYRPYRDEVRKRIAALIGAGAQVVHLSVHTFCPVLGGEIRNADLGLLYDPSRSEEKRFCHEWASLLRQSTPGFKVRYNYPYRGIDDGLTRFFRRCFSSQDYLGIELEVNQLLLAGDQTFPATLQNVLLESLRELIPAD